MLNCLSCRLDVIVADKTKSSAPSCIIFSHDFHTYDIAIVAEEILQSFVGHIVWNVEYEQIRSVWASGPASTLVLVVWLPRVDGGAPAYRSLGRLTLEGPPWSFV